MAVEFESIGGKPGSRAFDIFLKCFERGILVRAAGDASDQRFLYALLLSGLVQRQVRGKTTGTSGRRRLDRDMFDSMLVPWPDREERVAIAAEVDRRRAEARRLRAEARAGWAKAQQAFENALLGPAA